MRPLFLGFSALASTLVLACNDPSAPATAVEATSTPTAALVNRFSIPFLETLVDGDLVAVMGLSPGEFPAFCAGDDSVLDQVTVQEVSRPDGSLKLTIRGSPRLIIYPLGDATFLCDLATVSPLATGKAQLARTDNDLFVSLNRTNSFGSNLTGIAAGDGGRFKVRARFRVTIQRNGVSTLRTERFGITRLGS